ncbi:hypothetical protein CLOM_g1376, partial [Closterium sp. NIES-68]
MRVFQRIGSAQSAPAAAAPASAGPRRPAALLSHGQRTRLTAVPAAGAPSGSGHGGRTPPAAQMRAGALAALVALAALLILSDVTGLGPARMLRQRPPRASLPRVAQSAEGQVARNREEQVGAEGLEGAAEGSAVGFADADREINGWTLSALEAFARENNNSNGDHNTWNDTRARELELKYYKGRTIPVWREWSGEGEKRSGGMVIGLNEKGRQVWGLAQLRVTSANVTIKYEKLTGGRGGGGAGEEESEVREVGVRFRGATWRPAVGRWLKAYADPLPAVVVEE